MMKRVILALSLSLASTSLLAENTTNGLAVDTDTLKSLIDSRHEKSALFRLPEEYLTSKALRYGIEPSHTFEQAAHVINGVALRNRTSGTIAARGVPSDAKIVKAFLYWNFSDDLSLGNKQASILIDGNRVNGKKTADNGSLCWANAGNHTYKADVTAYIRPTKANNDYVVTAQFDSVTSTTGNNPWSSFSAQKLRVNGAWLVLVYTGKNTNGDVFIYDSLSNTDFSGTLNLALYHTPKFGNGLFSMGGADGQRGFGHTNFASNETSWFNFKQIAGPPVAMSDWDGTDGLPLPQLSDTHTHHVDNLKDTVSQVKYISGGDCLVPTVFVIEG